MKIKKLLVLEAILSFLILHWWLCLRIQTMILYHWIGNLSTNSINRYLICEILNLGTYNYAIVLFHKPRAKLGAIRIGSWWKGVQLGSEYGWLRSAVGVIETVITARISLWYCVRKWTDYQLVLHNSDSVIHFCHFLLNHGWFLSTDIMINC